MDYSLQSSFATCKQMNSRKFVFMAGVGLKIKISILLEGIEDIVTNIETLNWYGQ